VTNSTGANAQPPSAPNSTYWRDDPARALLGAQLIEEVRSGIEPSAVSRGGRCVAAARLVGDPLQGEHRLAQVGLRFHF